MEKISTLFGKRAPLPNKTHATERGELLDTFLSRLNPARERAGYKQLDHKRLSYKLAGIETKDLYALLSKCNDAERRGYAWGAIFEMELKAPKPNDV